MLQSYGPSGPQTSNSGPGPYPGKGPGGPPGMGQGPQSAGPQQQPPRPPPNYPHYGQRPPMYPGNVSDCRSVPLRLPKSLIRLAIGYLCILIHHG